MKRKFLFFFMDIENRIDFKSVNLSRYNRCTLFFEYFSKQSTKDVFIWVLIYDRQFCDLVEFSFPFFFPKSIQRKTKVRDFALSSDWFVSLRHRDYLQSEKRLKKDAPPRVRCKRAN